MATKPLDVGSKVPKLPLALSSGLTGSTADHLSHWLVLYFYPKDATPGCTTEGLEFNALLSKFTRLDATVLGVSRDSIKSHQNFCDKQGFKFDLVRDADEKLGHALGVIRSRKLSGSDFIGTERRDFLIEPRDRHQHACQRDS